MLYLNVITGAVFDSSVSVNGDHIRPYKQVQPAEEDVSIIATNHEDEITAVNLTDVPEELANRTVEELKQIAANSRINLAGATKKQDIIRAILASEQASE